jgi:ribonuclease HI
MYMPAHTNTVLDRRLLLTGPETIALYADASYAAEVGVGCWACIVPAFPALRSGIEYGGSINRLEFAAVIHGLLLATTVDHSCRPIHVHTDFEFVITVMQHVARRTKLPASKGFIAVADLYSQACDVTSCRVLMTTRRRSGDPYHTACDKVAKEELRRYCSHGSVARTILLKRAEARRTTVLRQMGHVERTFEKLPRQLLACEIEIGALQDGG